MDKPRYNPEYLRLLLQAMNQDTDYNGVPFFFVCAVCGSNEVRVAITERKGHSWPPHLGYICTGCGNSAELDLKGQDGETIIFRTTAEDAQSNYEQFMGYIKQEYGEDPIPWGPLDEEYHDALMDDEDADYAG